MSYYDNSPSTPDYFDSPRAVQEEVWEVWHKGEFKYLYYVDNYDDKGEAKKRAQETADELGGGYIKHGYEEESIDCYPCFT